eukprot:2736300-Pyramimonas_sp.AAC.2
MRASPLHCGSTGAFVRPLPEPVDAHHARGNVLLHTPDSVPLRASGEGFGRGRHRVPSLGGVLAEPRRVREGESQHLRTWDGMRSRLSS